MSPFFGRQCIRCGEKAATRSERCTPCNRLLDRVMAGMLDGGMNGQDVAEEVGLSNDVVNQRVSRLRRKQEASHVE